MFRTDASKSSRFDRASGRYYEPNVVVQQVHLVGGNPSDRNQPVVCPSLRYIADTSYLRPLKRLGTWADAGLAVMTCRMNDMIKLLSLWEVSHFESDRAKFRETSGETSGEEEQV